MFAIFAFGCHLRNVSLLSLSAKHLAYSPRHCVRKPNQIREVVVRQVIIAVT